MVEPIIFTAGKLVVVEGRELTKYFLLTGVDIDRRAFPSNVRDNRRRTGVNFSEPNRFVEAVEIAARIKEELILANHEIIRRLPATTIGSVVVMLQGHSIAANENARSVRAVSQIPEDLVGRYHVVTTKLGLSVALK